MKRSSPGRRKNFPPLTLNAFSGMMRRLAALLPKHAARVVLAVMVAGLFAVSAAHAAPMSTLYMIDNTNPTSVLWTVQGGTGVTTSTPIGSFDSAIAVTSTIKTLGWDWVDDIGSPGAQYTLKGVPTGTTYAFPPAASAAFYDGASDGTNFYSVDFNTNTVYEFNSNWANPTPLFADASGGYYGDVGITYDTKNNTIWLGNYMTANLLHYTLNGTLLADFQLNSNNSYGGLALDPADGTLWVWNGNGGLEQYSQTGALLNTPTLPGVGTYDFIAGAEFAEATPTPIPGALLLFAPGLAGLAFVRRRFGK